MRLRALWQHAARGRRTLALSVLGVALVLATVSAATGSALGASGLKAGAALLVLGLAAAVLGRREARLPDAGPLSVEARQPLSREAGLAVVPAGGRRCLYGPGAGGVAILAELDGAEASR